MINFHEKLIKCIQNYSIRNSFLSNSKNFDFLIINFLIHISFYYFMSYHITRMVFSFCFHFPLFPSLIHAWQYGKHLSLFPVFFQTANHYCIWEVVVTMTCFVSFYVIMHKKKKKKQTSTCSRTSITHICITFSLLKLVCERCTVAHIFLFSYT